ncbi:hypothetical protein BJ912DRAFT_99309 [Pholiota molesta]|nr:hypothetical protein BJ912DRAFT_99309 [Pholiota molesta]
MSLRLGASPRCALPPLLALTTLSTPSSLLCPLHSPQGQCLAALTSIRTAPSTPIAHVNALADVDLRARPDCRAVTTRPAHFVRPDDPRHVTAPLRFPAYMCNDRDVKRHNDDKREWHCGAQIWVEPWPLPRRFWDAGPPYLFMNKEAACKAASATQRRIGWAVSQHLHRYLQVYLQGNL